MARKARPAERTRTAFHEAGHAVIARVLRLSVEQVTIKKNGRTLGAVSHRAGNQLPLGPAIHTELEWQERERPGSTAGFKSIAPRDAALHAHIIATLAGAVAEKECLGGCVKGNGSDNYQVAQMLVWLSGDSTARRARLKKMTRMLVRRHKATIARVANRLAAVEILNPEQLDRLIARGSTCRARFATRPSKPVRPVAA